MSEREAALDALLAREEIRQLPLRYASALNRGDVEAMVDLFVPEARFGPYGEGPDALRSLTRDSIDGAHLIVLLVTNHLVDLASLDEATGEVWAQAISHTEADGYVEQVVKYEDRYARHEGRWRFARRRHRLLFGRAPDPSPLRQRPADWPNRQVGVGDLALESDAFARWYDSQRDDRRP